MDIKEYLDRSRTQRKKTSQAANAFLNKTIEENENGILVNALEDRYKPTPQGLKRFESQISHQLKKIFRPELVEPKVKGHSLININTKERIHKIYSRNAFLIKRKQEIMIPRYRLTSLKVVSSILSKKALEASPYSPHKQTKPYIVPLSHKKLSNPGLISSRTEENFSTQVNC